MAPPADKAPEKYDVLLEKAAWAFQDANQTNLSAPRGVAIRNLPLEHGNGYADDLLYLDGSAMRSRSPIISVCNFQKENHLTLNDVVLMDEPCGKVKN